jgi:hypothetical protein
MEEVENKKSLGLIRSRNWLKARLWGFHMNAACLTEEEKKIATELESARVALLESWGKQTEVFLGHPLEGHKCHWCGRRSKTAWTYTDWSGINNYCRKHYKQPFN